MTVSWYLTCETRQDHAKAENLAKGQNLLKKNLQNSISLKSSQTPRDGTDVSPREPYWGQLDGLRAFAVAGVVAHHYMDGLGSLGYFSVRLLFVLSGFLITGILLKCRYLVEAGIQSRARSMRQFYVRRFLRIFPLYYAVLGVAWLMRVPDVREALLWHVSYLSNFHFIKLGWFPATTAHLWALSIEVHFYLLWPLVVLFVPSKWLVRLFVLMFVAGHIFRLLALVSGMSWIALYISTPSSFDSLAMGALLAYLSQKDSGNPSWPDYLAIVGRWIACIGILARVALPVLNITSFETIWLYISYSLWPLVCLWLIHGASRGFKGLVGTVLTARPIAYFGKISYGVYVYHLFMLTLVPNLFKSLGIEFLEFHALERFALLSASTIGVSAISWLALEKPINSLKRFFPYQAGSMDKIASY